MDTTAAMDTTARTPFIHCPCTFCRSLSSPGALLTRMRPISFQQACALIDRHPLLRQHLIVRQLLDMGAEPHEINHTSLPLPLLLPEEWRVAILDNMERDVSVVHDPTTASTMVATMTSTTATTVGSTVAAIATTTDVATETDIVVVDGDDDEGDDSMVANINDNAATDEDGAPRRSTTTSTTTTTTPTITASPTTISLATLLKHPPHRYRAHGKDLDFILLGKHNRNKRK